MFSSDLFHNIFAIFSKTLVFMNIIIHVRLTLTSTDTIFLHIYLRGEGHFGAADSVLDNWAPCRFGAGNFSAIS